jgi:hypothetical protein
MRMMDVTGNIMDGTSNACRELLLVSISFEAMKIAMATMTTARRREIEER